MTSSATLLGVVRSVVVAAILVQPQTTQGPKRATTHPEIVQPQRGSDSVPVVVKLLPPPNQKAAADEQAQENRRKATVDNRIVGLTIALVAVGVFQLFLFVWQLTQINRSLADAKRAADAATAGASAAKEAADATKETANVMRENATSEARITAIGLRAYVTVQWEADGFRRWEAQDGIFLQWRATIINKGNTPALNVRSIGKAFVFPHPLPASFDRDGTTLSLVEEARPAGGTTLVSGQATGCTAICGPLPPDTAQSAGLGQTAKYYVLWTVLYEDVFGEQRQTLNGYTERWDAVGIGRVHSADFHNRAD